MLASDRFASGRMLESVILLAKVEAPPGFEPGVEVLQTF
jgi:hypothetical protein